MGKMRLLKFFFFNYCVKEKTDKNTFPIKSIWLLDWLKSTKNLKLSQMHCKSLQFLGERSPWDFKKSLKTPRVCRARPRANFWKADSTYWYVLSVALKCWGNSSKLSLNSSKSLSAIFVWPQRRFFTCPNGFSRTTTLRGEGSIGNQKSARQRFLQEKALQKPSK